MARELVLGVDGGASGVRAVEVRARADGLLEAGPVRASRTYPRDAGFAPAPLDVQRAAASSGPLGIAAPERAAGAARVRCAAEAVAEAAARAGAASVTLGVCMPGLKTADGRGIAVLRNGPRMPSYLDDLERGLAELGVALARPIPALASDGLAAALGERHAVAGGLCDVEDALYLGGGTGLSEALVLGGRVRSLDGLAGVLEKAWAMEFERGVAYEDVLSMGGWNRIWARTAGLSEPLGAGDLPEQAALRGDARARALLARSGEALARLCADRRARLRAHAAVELQRAVVGAQLGALLARADLAALLLAPAAAALRAHGFADGFLRASTLRDAPALGAAFLALGREG
jgi:hypothetical protein